jgi:hypothetical protein
MQNQLLNLFNVFLFICLIPGKSTATKLVEVLPVDNNCIVLHFQDGEVEYNWDDTISGSCNGWDYFHTEKWSLCPDKDQYIPFGNALNTQKPVLQNSFVIVSINDKNYGLQGKTPLKVFRKSKVWEAAIDERKPAMHHWIYLELPHPLQKGMEYTVRIDKETQSDKTELALVFDELKLESPAIKISNIGYEKSATFKSADIYLWMGDGGGRDFSRFSGKDFYLFDNQSQQRVYSGKVKFRMKSQPEPEFNKNFTGADIWECDFSDFKQPGNYRLLIEGLGSSPTFTIGENRFLEAFKVAMQGMFYQRMGCVEKPAGDNPKARRPLYRQGVEPEGFKVFISKKEMVTGTNPDDRKWYSEELTGEVAKETWGGWVDAYDNDQRPDNFICTFDILLTYYLNPNLYTDNQLYIPESNNGIPDILDEALYEIDWWLRMRDAEGGYLTGLTNITDQKENFAGAPCAWQGWCVAAGCAMAADCFRLNGNKELMEKYLKEAKTAYEWALKQPDQMLEIASGDLRGKDLKMTAAACLFNLTGEKDFEEVVKTESETYHSNSKVKNMGKWEQQFAAVPYVLSPQKVNYPELQNHMKQSIINQAKVDYVDKMKNSPTKAARWTAGWEGLMQTSNEMSLVAIAHKFSESETEKAYFEGGLYAEAEWTLGRNPLGLVQMTGLTDRCFTQTFAPGRRDGYPGLTPGWTPYMCRDGWMRGDDNIIACDWYTARNYPSDKEVWPWGEHFWNSRYCVPNAETTPQQTFRQKIVLYGYLFALGNRK